MMKGIACQIMVFAHAITMNFGALSVPEKAFFTFIIYPAGLFFLASGVNVVLFFEKSRGREGFQASRFFLMAALVLFVLSLPYSINRNNLFVPQIFQGIAATYAATYLLLRARLSNTWLVVIAFASYLLWFGVWYSVAGDIAALRHLDTREIFPATLTWLKQLGPAHRFLFVNFALFPWVSYMLTGAAWYRSNRDHPEHLWRWVALFCACLGVGVSSIAVGALDQPLLLDNFADMLMRNVPVHFFSWMGLNGLTAIAFARWYRGTDHFANSRVRWVLRYVEYTGKESLMFFVWHWVILFSASVLLHVLGIFTYLADPPFKAHLTWIIAMPVVAWTLPKVVAFGKKWSQRRNFVYEVMTVWIVGSAFSLRLIKGRADVPPAAFVLSLLASIAFAAFYPVARQILRERYTVRPRTIRRK